MSELPHAERRAGGDPAHAIAGDVAGPSGDLRPSLRLIAPARVTWSLHLPRHARLRTAVFGRGSIRIGLSDGRTYHEVVRLVASEVWQPVDVDLREHSEWKVSLFYQPLRTEWRLVINADATAPGGDNHLALDRPVLTSADVQ